MTDDEVRISDLRREYIYFHLEPLSHEDCADTMKARTLAAATDWFGVDSPMLAILRNLATGFIDVDHAIERYESVTGTDMTPVHKFGTEASKFEGLAYAIDGARMELMQQTDYQSEYVFELWENLRLRGMAEAQIAKYYEDYVQ